jgi:hypothetical protein
VLPDSKVKAGSSMEQGHAPEMLSASKVKSIMMGKEPAYAFEMLPDQK